MSSRRTVLHRHNCRCNVCIQARRDERERQAVARPKRRGKGPTDKEKQDG